MGKKNRFFLLGLSKAGQFVLKVFFTVRAVLHVQLNIQISISLPVKNNIRMVFKSAGEYYYYPIRAR